MESGFSRKSKAPSLVALTAVSMLPWPEIMTTTGRSGRGHLLDPRQHFHAVLAGQPDVQENQLAGLFGQLFQAGLAALDGAGEITLVLQHAAQRLADARLVIDNQDSNLLHAVGQASWPVFFDVTRPAGLSYATVTSASTATGTSTVNLAPAG